MVDEFYFALTRDWACWFLTAICYYWWNSLNDLRTDWLRLACPEFDGFVDEELL